MKSLISKSFSTLKYPNFNQIMLSKSKILKKSIKEFYPLAKKLSQNSLSSSIGISRYDIFQEFKDSSSFLFLEVYNGPNIFEKQIESKHFENFIFEVENLLEIPFDLMEYKSIYPPQVSLILSLYISLFFTLFCSLIC